MLAAKGLVAMTQVMSDRQVLPLPRTGPPPLRQVRSWTAALLDEHPADTRDDVVLTASELVLNAYEHGEAPVELALVLGEGSTVRVEVSDCSAQPPKVRSPRPDEHRGRGLVMVTAYASRWGWRPTAEGKAVWVEFAPHHALRSPGTALG
ncbi:hypothetical protein GCM10010174_79660 [Kutzneria viridogrisea]